MHTVIRSYSGSGATGLIDLLEERREEVESLIRAVTGFVSYSLLHRREPPACKGVDSGARIAFECESANSSGRRKYLAIELVQK